jgi:hypothetical protein
MIPAILSTGQEFVALPDKGGLSELAQVWVLPCHVSLEAMMEASLVAGRRIS